MCISIIFPCFILIIIYKVDSCTFILSFTVGITCINAGNPALSCYIPTRTSTHFKTYVTAAENCTAECRVIKCLLFTI